MSVVVLFGLETVGVWPADAERTSKKNAIVGPLPRTKENVARCLAFANPEAVDLVRGFRDHLKSNRVVETADGLMSKAETVLQKFKQLERVR